MNAGPWLGGPSATEIEHQCLRWLAEMIGVGSDAIRSVPCDDDYQMDPTALDEMLIEDTENGAFRSVSSPGSAR